MKIRGTFAVIFAVSLVLLAGCGGDQTEKKQSEKASSQQAKPAQKAELKIALGTISKIDVDKNRLLLRPTASDHVMRFGLVKEAGITLNGRKAELADLEPGQQANIKYVAGKGNMNRARAVQVFGRFGGKKAGGGGEKTSGGGETTSG